ncbi:nitrilase family protein [Cellulophaga omnivescoria]|uniref:nitrilase family protein n=1 Tax=Cellulophaga omnivescoria TaxID=1888890 RepID=UPI000987D2F4|nr:nitrilase family protein [Cellulophaga omnivescoria]WBU90447.1 nitrilase family protein [Cellulophaga omnivescoria]
MSSSNTLHITLVQTPIIWENPVENRNVLSTKIKAITTKTDLVVLPEMFTTGFTMTPNNVPIEEGKKTLKWMQAIAKDKNCAITGSIAYSENNILYNRLFFVFEDGTYNIYNKKHTFTLAGENKVYQAGNNKLIVTYKGFKICPLICYDLRFPVWARNTEDYDILLYVANWPKQRITAWDTLLKARAIENMSYCIGVNRVGKDNTDYEYTGHSAIYDTLGNKICFSVSEEILQTTLSKQHIIDTRNKLKFLEDRDTFTL